MRGNNFHSIILAERVYIMHTYNSNAHTKYVQSAHKNVERTNYAKLKVIFRTINSEAPRSTYIGMSKQKRALTKQQTIQRSVAAYVSFSVRASIHDTYRILCETDGKIP